MSIVTAEKVVSASSRLAALAIVEEVYAKEKRWIDDIASEISPAVDSDLRSSWFLARVDGEPAGVIRLSYDPTLELPAELGVEIEPGFDLASYAAGKRFAEIGRFMIGRRFRRDVRVSLQLMRTAVGEVAGRGYTHLVTDVFESDRHSPLGFHLRVLGFERIGTHRFGELRCASRRVILVLDLARAYQRLRGQRNKVFRALTAGIDGALAKLPLTHPV